MPFRFHYNILGWSSSGNTCSDALAHEALGGQTSGVSTDNHLPANILLPLVVFKTSTLEDIVLISEPPALTSMRWKYSCQNGGTTVSAVGVDGT